MIPSLLALDSARRFGKESDVSFMKNNMPENSIITLDYKAWELVKVPDAGGFIYLRR